MRTGAIVTLAVATAALAGASGVAGAPPAAPATPVEAAFIPSGVFHTSVRRWTVTRVQPRYRRAPSDAAAGALVLTVTPDLYVVPVYPPPRPAPRSGDLERLGVRAGTRLAERAREIVEEAIDGLDPSVDVDDPDGDDEVPTNPSGLVVETCGLVAGWAGLALLDDRLGRDELDALVDRARSAGWSHAAGGTRARYAEASYLGLMAAELAEGLRPYANDPARYPSGAGSRGDALVGRACRTALRAVGLRGVGYDWFLFPSISFTEPATVFVRAPRAEADGLGCWYIGPGVRRCAWFSPF